MLNPKQLTMQKRIKASSVSKCTYASVLILLSLLFFCAGPCWGLQLELATSVVPAGSDAGLMSPSGLWFDRLRDNLLIADTENNRILLVNQQGDVIKTLGRKGELYLPISVAVNLRGTLFVAERNKSVLKVKLTILQLRELSPGRRSSFATMDTKATK